MFEILNSHANVDLPFSLDATFQINQSRSNFGNGAVYNGEVVLPFGLAGTGINHPATILHADLTTGATHTVNYSRAFDYASSVQIGKELYIVDGSTRNDFIKYDLDTRTFTTLANCPNNHAQAFLVHHQGKIYKIGGRTGAAVYNGLVCYDIATNTWSSLALMPIVTTAFHATVYDNKIIVSYGCEASGINDIPGFQIYDIATNSWTYTQVNFKGTTRWHTSIVYGKYLFMTTVANGVVVLRYNLESGQIRKFYNKTDLSAFGASCFIDEVTEELVIFGGAAINYVPNHESGPRNKSIIRIPLDQLLDFTDRFD